MGIDEQEMIDFPESGIERAIKKMEEREARWSQVENQAMLQVAEPFAHILEPYDNFYGSNSGMITTASMLGGVASMVPDNAVESITNALGVATTVMQPYNDLDFGNSSVLAALHSAVETPELLKFQSQLEESVQMMGTGLSAMTDYASALSEQWNHALNVADIAERSMAAQNIAMVRMLPDYSSLDLPRGSRRVLKSLTKTAAKKLTQTENIKFDPKEREFYHKDSPEQKLTADQITVTESLQELFAEFSLDELLSFESKLEKNFAFALRHPVGDRIFKIIEGWNKYIDLEEFTYYHARKLNDGQRPYCDHEMMKAPRNVSSHGRYNEIGKSCYYIAETKEGALNEIRKHSGGTKPRIQIVGLKRIKAAKILDLSGKINGSNRFMEHLRFTVENEEGKTIQEYLLPNFVASCCKEIGIEGIKYRSTGYNCCVLWKDDYFGFVEGSREIIESEKEDK